jgi:hypothetical protein
MCTSSEDFRSQVLVFATDMVLEEGVEQDKPTENTELADSNKGKKR